MTAKSVYTLIYARSYVKLRVYFVVPYWDHFW